MLPINIDRDEFEQQVLNIDLDVIAFETEREQVFNQSLKIEQFSAKYQEEPAKIPNNTQDESVEEPETDIQPEPELNTELYSAGFFDGLNGLNAQLPHLKDYWYGYQLAYREYCCGLLKLKIPKSEQELYPWQHLATA